MFFIQRQKKARVTLLCPTSGVVKGAVGVCHVKFINVICCPNGNCEAKNSLSLCGINNQQFSFQWITVTKKQ